MNQEIFIHGLIMGICWEELPHVMIDTAIFYLTPPVPCAKLLPSLSTAKHSKEAYHDRALA